MCSRAAAFASTVLWASPARAGGPLEGRLAADDSNHHYGTGILRDSFKLYGVQKRKRDRETLWDTDICQRQGDSAGCRNGRKTASLSETHK